MSWSFQQAGIDICTCQNVPLTSGCFGLIDHLISKLHETHLQINRQ